MTPDIPAARSLFATVALMAGGVLIGGSLAVTADRWNGEAAVNATDLFTTEYQAVLLSNGEAYYGKLEHLDAAYAVLSDVYYVRQRSAGDEEQMKFVLIKRGGEWHRPDRMVVNAAHITFIEPVTAGSEVAKFIAQSQKP